MGFSFWGRFVPLGQEHRMRQAANAIHFRNTWQAPCIESFLPPRFPMRPEASPRGAATSRSLRRARDMDECAATLAEMKNEVQTAD
jgi:hypothetical protein